jgi:hypothetical protein
VLGRCVFAEATSTRNAGLVSLNFSLVSGEIPLQVGVEDAQMCAHVRKNAMLSAATCVRIRSLVAKSEDQPTLCHHPHIPTETLTRRDFEASTGMAVGHTVLGHHVLILQSPVPSRGWRGQNCSQNIMALKGCRLKISLITQLH